MENSARDEGEYFKNYYKDNKKRYKERYISNKQKKIDQQNNSLTKNY